MNKTNNNTYCLMDEDEREPYNTDDRIMKYYRIPGKHSDKIY